MNKKLSDEIRDFFLSGNFELTNNLNEDVNRYIKHMKISSGILHFDSILRKIIFRLSFGRDITVHTLTDGAVEKIKHTRIESIPNGIPRFMKNAFLIEARHNKNLFDNIQSIGGFIANDEMNLIYVTDDKNNNLYTQTFPLSFDGRKIEDLNMIYKKESNIPYLVYMKERKDIFAFALIFAIMLEAEKTPLVVDAKSDKKQNSHKAKPRGKSDWIEKRVYIDKAVIYERKAKATGESLNKDGKFLKDTVVRAFCRLQRFGKGLSELKWTYIENYPSRRWVNTGNKKITVDVYGKS